MLPRALCIPPHLFYLSTLGAFSSFSLLHFSHQRRGQLFIFPCRCPACTFCFTVTTRHAFPPFSLIPSFFFVYPISLIFLCSFISFSSCIMLSIIAYPFSLLTICSLPYFLYQKRRSTTTHCCCCNLYLCPICSCSLSTPYKLNCTRKMIDMQSWKSRADSLLDPGRMCTIRCCLVQVQD